MEINEKELKVLKQLSSSYDPEDWGAFYFKSLISSTGLELKEVRRACRSLAKKGLAKYERGLVDEDGIPAGSGYRATEEGAAFITPCNVCGRRATYDYWTDEKGDVSYWNLAGHEVHILECEQHYKQSAVQAILV